MQASQTTKPGSARVVASVNYAAIPYLKVTDDRKRPIRARYAGSGFVINATTPRSPWKNPSSNIRVGSVCSPMIRVMFIGGNPPSPNFKKTA